MAAAWRLDVDEERRIAASAASLSQAMQRAIGAMTRWRTDRRGDTGRADDGCCGGSEGGRDAAARPRTMAGGGARSTQQPKTSNGRQRRDRIRDMTRNQCSRSLTSDERESGPIARVAVVCAVSCGWGSSARLRCGDEQWRRATSTSNRAAGAAERQQRERDPVRCQFGVVSGPAGTCRRAGPYQVKGSGALTERILGDPVRCQFGVVSGPAGTCRRGGPYQVKGSGALTERILGVCRTV
ncbi:hypothetical protein Scep_009515 [Stephania cephalantha]|uniref:Uncharacterized protein n=1 Tax=Stephania cephalantha TaxID=152367 RepID=A0AAP0JU49_9MAGN